MYGLINISVKNLVTEKFGIEKWNQVVSKANLEDDFFISNKTYDDKITYDLVRACSEVLGLSAEAVLKEFGHYWVLSVAPKAYGALLDAGGRTFEDFLVNLPSFHNRVMLIYPNVKPPQFEVNREGSGRLKLTYSSTRDGLLPFVVGLIEGLAVRFGTKVKIEYLGPAETGKHEFIIQN